MERLLRRSPATNLRWAGFCLVGIGIIVACSDDESTSGGTAGAGGEGGEKIENAGATPSDAGTGVTMNGGAGGVGMAAAGEGGIGEGGIRAGGAGGMGGMAQELTLGEQCSACGAAECADIVQGCTDSTECSGWMSCLTSCDSPECMSNCDALHADASRVYAGVYDCLCSSCKDECSAAGACEKKTCVDDAGLLPSEVAPATLAETGLYATLEGAGGGGGAGGAGGVELATPIAIASQVRTYEPTYPLWADDATKQRYVYIPKCKTIDTTDMDHWKFPVGTRFWKAFTVGETRVETRLMHRFGPGEADWLFATYQWDPARPNDPAAAKLVSDPTEYPTGVANANGTDHDIPPLNACNNCHNKLSERVLGFGALELSHTAALGDVAIKEISDLGWLTTPAPAGFQVPGTPTQQAALGYLHGNCGGCHNQGQGIPNAQNPLILRLLVGKTDYSMTDTVKTSVDVIVSSGLTEITGKPRIDPMAPANSAILVRMTEAARGSSLQMPPLATKSTKHEDPTGIAAVTAWVNSIP